MGASSADYAKRILRLRRARGLSQQELAALIGVSARSVIRWERGLAQPTPSVRRQILSAEAFSPDATRQPRSLPSRLPTSLTSFIGRERELQDITQLLAVSRFVTLTGAGGSGKTRLALEVARGIERAFPDGICFVGLAPTADHHLVPFAIMQALGIAELETQPPAARLSDFLRDKQLLLLLDNFEHLLPAALLVIELLGSCPGLTVLVTSRERLHLSGERIYPVPPLGLPGSGADGTGRRTASSTAVQLFLERAETVRPGFSSTAEELVTIAEICRRVDGLPLAIELAVAWIRLLPAQALLTRLGRRLAMLTGGASDLPARQRTLRDTIAWSHELLTPTEQRLFRRLAVFAGGFGLDAAAAVYGDTDEAAGALTAIASLADKSLLTSRTTAENEARFSMLETIREFAAEQLTASDEAEDTRRRQAAYYLALVQSRPVGSEHHALPRWLHRLASELDNLRAVLVWSMERPEQSPIALRLVAALNTYWEVCGYWSEGRSWATRVLEAAVDPTAQDLVPALLSAGNLAYFQGDLVAAKDYLNRSLGIVREGPESLERAMCLRFLARVAMDEGDLDTACALSAEGLGVAESLGARMEVAVGLNVQGGISARRGDLEAAEASWEKGLAIARAFESLSVIALFLGQLARSALVRGNVGRSQALHEETLAIAEEIGDRKAIARSLGGLAMLAFVLGDEGEALRRAEEALALYRSMGARREPVGVLSLLALLRRRLGDEAAACALYQECLAVAGETHETAALAAAMLRLASAAPAGTEPGGVEAALIRLIGKLAEMQHSRRQPEQAARLLGIADGLHARLGRPGSTPGEALERTAAALRSTLDVQAFISAREAGRLVSLRQAIDELVLLTDPSTGPRPAASAPAVRSSPYPDRLTARELQVIQMIAAGRSNSQIAASLVVSARTVERHIENVYAKLGLHGRAARAAVAIYASRRGLLAAGTEQPA